MLRIVVILLAAVAGVAAIDLDITPEDVDRALAIGRRPAESTAFHASYVHSLDETVDGVTIRQIEVVTPFRRVVLLGDERRRLGDYVVSRADAEEVLRPWRMRVAVVATARFHPQNLLTSVPAIDVTLRDPVLDTNVPALETTRKAATAAGKPRPILGATVETVFDAGLIARLDAVIVVSLRGTELARTTIDFRRLE